MTCTPSSFSEATTLPALTVERLADDLAATITAMGETQADVVALSMGGYVALALADRHPEVIRSLALVDTQATADDEAGRSGRRAAAVRVVAEGRAALMDVCTERGWHCIDPTEEFLAAVDEGHLGWRGDRGQ